MKDWNIDDRIADVLIFLVIGVVIGLKVTGVITIPWIWLLSPLWGLVAVGFIFALVVGLYMCGLLIIDKIAKRRKQYGNEH